MANMKTKLITELTKPRAKVLGFIKKYYAKHGYAPSRMEISEACGYNSANSAQNMLKLLARDGFIKLDRRSARNITLP